MKRTPFRGLEKPTIQRTMSKLTLPVFLIASTAAWAAPPTGSPARNYEDLWKNSPFTIPAPAVEKPKAPDPVQMSRQITELRERVRQLEAMVAALTAEAAPREKPPRRRGEAKAGNRTAAGWLRIGGSWRRSTERESRTATPRNG